MIILALEIVLAQRLYPTIAGFVFSSNPKVSMFKHEW